MGTGIRRTLAKRCSGSGRLDSRRNRSSAPSYSRKKRLHWTLAHRRRQRSPLSRWRSRRTPANSRRERSGPRERSSNPEFQRQHRHRTVARPTTPTSPAAVQRPHRVRHRRRFPATCSATPPQRRAPTSRRRTCTTLWQPRALLIEMKARNLDTLRALQSLRLM